MHVFTWIWYEFLSAVFVIPTLRESVSLNGFEWKQTGDSSGPSPVEDAWKMRDLMKSVQSSRVWALSAHSYNTVATGVLLVAVGGRGKRLLWAREHAAW